MYVSPTGELIMYATEHYADGPGNTVQFAEYRHIDVFRRRDVVREDGWALRWLLHNPALIPASVMLRRQVVEQLGGFDEALRTAEDLEFHLRIARHWRVMWPHAADFRSRIERGDNSGTETCLTIVTYT